jgi:hypothetical protein
MTLQQQQVRFERLTRRLERKYSAIFAGVFFSQLEQYAKAIRKQPLNAIYSIDTYFPDEPLERAYRQMVMECFDTFRMDDPAVLIKAIDSSVWVTMVTQYITNVGGERITQINQYTKAYTLAKIRNVLNDGVENGLGIADISENMVSKIAEYAKDFSRYRAQRVARTEIIGSSNRAGLMSVQAAGISDQVQKFWLPAVDERTRQTHLDMRDHEPIAIGELFEVPRLSGGIDRMEYPGDPRGSAENVIQCRCTIGYQRV